MKAPYNTVELTQILARLYPNMGVEKGTGLPKALAQYCYHAYVGGVTLPECESKMLDSAALDLNTLGYLRNYPEEFVAAYMQSFYKKWFNRKVAQFACDVLKRAIEMKFRPHEFHFEQPYLKIGFFDGLYYFNRTLIRHNDITSGDTLCISFVMDMELHITEVCVDGELFDSARWTESELASLNKELENERPVFKEAA